MILVPFKHHFARLKYRLSKQSAQTNLITFKARSIRWQAQEIYMSVTNLFSLTQTIRDSKVDVYSKSYGNMAVFFLVWTPVESKRVTCICSVKSS